MDAFSEMIVKAVDKVKNSVVKVDKYSRFRGNEIISGTGSGFVFSSDGMILTNTHVIDEAERLNITLLDGDEFTAEVTGADRDTDIAIIKIFGSGYSPAKLGTSSDLKIGQLVIAIGNPMGYQHSVSVGVLSGVGRTMRTPDGHMIDNILQSDAAMNPGNSGGPMIDTNGDVIGINTAIIPFAQGLSFSIGIDTAKEIARYLISDGKVMKAYLGLMVNEIEIHPRIRNFYRISSKKGIMVIGVEKSSPASRAYLREGDIIVEFNGKNLSSSGELTRYLIGGQLIDKSVNLKVIRQAKALELNIIPVMRMAA
jgi:S1-C subfamily serine protease